MKQFIKRISVFSVFPMIVISTIISLYLYKIAKFEGLNKSIALQSKTLIMGDSQMQRIPSSSFNDSTYNYSSISEHYYFTFLKLKKLLNYEGNQIKTVILGVSVHNFAPIYRKSFDINLPQGIGSFSRYWPYLNNKESDFLNKKELSHLIKPFTNSVLENKFMEWGFKKSLNKNPDKETILSSLKHHYTDEQIGDELSQKKYLDKIVSICNLRKIRLIFVSTPIHQSYRDNVEDKYFKILANCIRNYPEIEYQNYLSVNTASDLLADGNHLNVGGGRIFALRIFRNLKKRTHNNVYTK